MAKRSPFTLPPEKPGGSRTGKPFREVNPFLEEYFENAANEQEKQQVRSRKKKVAMTKVKSLDMRIAYLLSLFLHAAPFMGWAMLTLVLLLMGIQLISPFDRPEIKKPPDMEFVLAPQSVEEKPPIDPDTHYLAEKQMRAGGEHDPTREVSLDQEVPPPSPPSPQKAASKPEPAPQKPQPEKKVENPKPKPKAKPKKVEQAKKQTQKPKKKPPKPVVKHQAKAKPKPVANTIPVPAVPLAKPVEQAPLPALAQGPITDEAPVSSSSQRIAPVLSNAAMASSASSYAPAFPALDGGRPNAGPGGDPNGPLGVDARKEPDFGPYMRYLQQRIKKAWQPPRGNESKRLVVVFRVNRRGELIRVQVTQSSGVKSADEAALKAIRKSFPYRSLPEEYAKDTIDIEFTFDYNVFNPKNQLGHP